MTAAVDLFGMSCHTGTHLDGLGHFARHLCLHGGVPVSEGQSKTEGIKCCGIEQVGPVLRRGVLLDVAAAEGVTCLEAGRTIAPTDLERAARMAQVEVRPGDVLLVRTGWLRHWPDQRKYNSVHSGQPGLDVEAARWATGHGVYCSGSDNFAVEYVPSPANTMPVHIHCLVEKGVHLLEVVGLEAAQKGPDARRRAGYPSARMGARREAYLVRTSQRRGRAPTPQTGLFQRPVTSAARRSNTGSPAMTRGCCAGSR